MTKSVVMATYNGAQYLTEQLDSILNQTCRIDELIICDDCSTDNTVEVARKYIGEHGLGGYWKVYVNENNLGYADNFNKATLLANGDLIFFSDQDDTWSLNKVEIMTKLMEEHPECQVLCTDYTPWYYGEGAPEAPKSVLEKMPDNGKLEKITLDKKSVYIGALGCCMCVRSSFYNSIKKYWFDGWAQDDRMWRLAQCADGCLLLHSNLIQHRIHCNNTSTYGKYHSKEKRVKLFNHMLEANKQMLRMLQDRNASVDKIKLMERHIRMMELRIGLIKDKKLGNNFLLLGFADLYQNKKSFVVENCVAFKK